jgi:hypothetical protein
MVLELLKIMFANLSQDLTPPNMSHSYAPSKIRERVKQCPSITNLD